LAPPFISPRRRLHRRPLLRHRLQAQRHPVDEEEEAAQQPEAPTFLSRRGNWPLLKYSRAERPSLASTALPATELIFAAEIWAAPNLLRSQLALSDQHGELIAPIVHGARQDKGMPAFALSDSDVIAIAEYIHSVLAQVGRQGRPPGAEDIPELKVIVGDPVAGKTYFDAKCASCHSVTGDLKGYATKYSDPRTLQNTWVAGSAAGGRGGFGPAAPEAGAKATTVTVTLADGQKLDGVLVQQNDFIVTLIGADGTRRSIARDNEVKSVEIHDPNEAHKKMALTLDDADMHNVTAYLATIK
jgi:cytochrome c oxidase cbb3-type subunit 3